MPKMKSILLLALACFLPIPAAQATASSVPQHRLAPSAPSNLLPLAETPAPKNIGVAEFEKLRAAKTNVVLDVRTKKEYEAGHMPGAINIDVNAPNFQKDVQALDRNKVYLVHCAAGRRSATACEKMSKLDFPRLYNLEGGFTAWEKAGNKAER